MLASMLLVSSNNPLHQRMANDIAPGKLDDRDPLDMPQDPVCFDQARAAMRGEIHLRFITGNYGLRIDAQARKKHEHLLGGRVLSFIENDEGVVERAAAHV